jgi:hypothetical protein
VVEAGRYHWAATRGVNEEMLLENLPEDLQRDIRRHLFKFVKKVRYKYPGLIKLLCCVLHAHLLLQILRAYNFPI